MVSTWNTAVLIFKACAKIKQDMTKKKEEAKFLASVFWTVIKMKIRSGTKLRRNGPTPEERLRRMIRGSLTSLGSAVHLRDVTAQKVVMYFFQGLEMRKELKRAIIDNGKWVRKIQERFRSYWAVRTAQIQFLVRMLQREKERM